METENNELEKKDNNNSLVIYYFQIHLIQAI
jgi:hypothetical protein